MIVCIHTNYYNCHVANYWLSDKLDYTKLTNKLFEEIT